MSQLKVDTITDEAGTGSPSLPNGLTVGGVNYPTTGPLSNRNKIINGAMVIDQRNAGAAVTPSSGSFVVDRFFYVATQASKVTSQQNAGGVTPPIGFSNYLGVTSASAYSVLTGDTFLLGQRIEGFNTTDLAFGTANAKPIALSFWARSSLTGTFGGAITNSDANRTYPFSYAISAADTWEFKTITVSGDTSGTWLTNNGIGLQVRFGLGSGATFSGTAGAWASGDFVQPTGSVSVVATNGATFYITGVQLEAGTVATPFEHRSFGQELALCQRYFQLCSPSLDVVQVSTTTANYSAQYPFACEMRAVPTLVNTTIGSSNLNTVNADSFPSNQARSFRYRLTTSTSAGLAVNAQSLVTASAEL
jgi:hypothetical protein